MTFRSLETADLAGKRALVRVDFNVPMDGGQITDDTRLRSALLLVKALLDSQVQGRPASVVVVRLAKYQSGCSWTQGLDSIARSTSNHSRNFMPAARTASLTGLRPLGCTTGLGCQSPTWKNQYSVLKLWYSSVSCAAPYQSASIQ